MFSVNTNISAQNTHTSLLHNDKNVSSSREKLSSGHSINRAADNAAGLEVANMLLTQINGTGQAQANAQDGISLLNTTDGALSDIGDSLQRVRELAVQSANGTLTASDRQSADAEAQQLLQHIDDVSQNTSFNGIQPLNNASTTITLQVGADNGQTQTANLTGTSSGSLGLSGLSLATQAGAQSALDSVSAAISQIDTQRGAVGAATNRLTSTINNLAITQQNSMEAESKIRDTDFASEYTKYTSSMILTNANIAIQAQANSKSSHLLALFQ